MSKKLIFAALSALVLSSGFALAQGTAPATSGMSGMSGATQTAPAVKMLAPAASSTPAATAPAAVPAPAAAQAAAKMVDLNTATEADLDKLPQVGPARAKAIIEARTKGGKFKNWDDFVARKVVPQNAEDAIKTLVKF